MQNKLSLVICTFKRSALLKNLLDDLDVQTKKRTDVEIIVVDNDVARSGFPVFCQFAFTRARYVVEPLQNISAARNHGLREAVEPFVLFLDDDQRIGVNFIEELFKNINNRAPFNALRLPVVPAFSVSAPLYFHQNKIFGFKDKFYEGILERDHMGTGGLIVRKTALSINPFDLKWGLSGGEDIDLFTRFSDDLWQSTAYPEVQETVPTIRMNTRYLQTLWRRKGQTDLQQDLKQYSKSQKWLVLFRSTVLLAILYTFSTLLSPLLPSLSIWLKCLMSRQRGKIDALRGLSPMAFYAPKQDHPINVLHVTQHMELGGAEKLLEQIAAAHSSEKVLLSFFFYNSKDDSPLMKEMSRFRHPIFLYQKAKGVDLQIFLKLLSIVRKQKISVIHCHDIGSLIYAIPLKILRPSVKLVHTIHTLHNWVNHPRYKIVYAIASIIADRTICVASHVRTTLGKVSGATTRRSVVVKNGVDLNRFQFHPESSENSIVSVSRVSPEKNINLLLAAYRDLESRHLDFSAVHLGSGPHDFFKQTNDLIGKYRLSSKVQMLGYRKDVEEQIKKAKIFVTASKEECAPVSVLEAMAVGKICICSDIPAHKELPNGSVLLFPVNESKALADILDKVLSNKIDIDQVRQNARLVVSKHYDLKNMINSYDEIYCSIVHHRA